MNNPVIGSLPFLGPFDPHKHSKPASQANYDRLISAIEGHNRIDPEEGSFIEIGRSHPTERKSGNLWQDFGSRVASPD